ncbi:MAG: hypothetical protein OCU22_00270 [Canidatus Methanoxibalbensis ujae]|nr:hypothetical protein [Candidatus Methanoxibalbensis ujae]
MKKEDFAKLEVKGMILLTDFSFCTFSFCAKKVCAKKVSLLSEEIQHSNERGAVASAAPRALI